MVRAAVTGSANIASNPPTKQKAIAAENTANVIGGSAMAFRSGHGRCSRPEVAVTFPASHRLTVRVIIVTMADATGASANTASTTRAVSSLEGSSGFQTSNRPRRIAPLMVAASVPSVSNAAMVISTAKPAVHSRMRPTGYHSSATGVATGATLASVETGWATGRPSRTRYPSHQAGSATPTLNEMQ